MQWLYDLLRLITDFFGVPVLYTILVTSITAFTGAVFFLNNFSTFRMRLAGIFAGEKSLYHRYFEALSYFLSRFRLIFYTGETTGSPRRSAATIYSTFLALALGYTAVLFFGGWASGGNGALGSVRVILADYSVPLRLAIAAGFGVLGYSVWLSFKYPDYLSESISVLLRRCNVPISSAVALALVGATLVLFSQLVSADRDFSLAPTTIFYIQLILAVIAFIAIWQGRPPIVAFTHVATACYGLALGVPILIGVPLAIAIATAIAGNIPLVLSTIFVPSLMLLYYYAVPVSFQNSPEANLALAGIACLPLLFTVLMVSLKRFYWPWAVIYTVISFFPVWLPVSASTKQISDPVAFAVVVFWFLVPVLNAFWDSISWALTWHLLDHLRRSLLAVRDEQIGRSIAVIQRVLILVGHVSVNLLTSGMLFLATFFVIIAAMQLVNLSIKPIHSEYMIDVPRLLTAVQQDSYRGDGLWVVAMVFATLVPALVHLCLVFVTGLMIAIGPAHVVKAWSVLQKEDKDIDASEFKTAVRTAAIYLAISAGFYAAILLALWNAYWGYGANRNIGDYLMSIGGAALRATEMFITKH